MRTAHPILEEVQIAPEQYLGAQAVGNEISFADRLAIGYLALPVLIFFATWFELVTAALLVVLLVLGASPLFSRRLRPTLGTSWEIALITLAVALAWSVLGGAGHFLYANSDWLIRDAVLRDLVVAGWPPAYGSVDGTELILRAPVAYYLPAALAGKVLSLQWADFALFVWTALGVWLFFMSVLPGTSTPRRCLMVILVVIFFSGMDVFGTERYFIGSSRITDHLEWWARIFQYSANTTQLFWVPNHALPGWIVAGLIYRHWRNPEFIKIAPFAFAMTALWSPLITIGLAPFAAFIAFFHMRRGSWRPGAVPWAWLGTVATFAAAAGYLMLDSATVRSGWTIGIIKPFDLLAMRYLRFVALEFALLAAAVALIRRDPLFWTSVVTLFAIPFYIIGAGNDFAMRASIPALMILCLTAADAVLKVDAVERVKMAMLLAFLAFGSITAIHEISRALLVPRWAPNLHLNLIETAHGAPPHYIARLKPPLSYFMGEPQAVPGAHLNASPVAQ